VPAAAVLGVLARFALLRYRRSSLYDPGFGEPAAALDEPADTITTLSRVR